MGARAEITVSACGRKVVVKELTVGEIRRWLAELPTGAADDLADHLLFDDVALSELERMTDLSADEVSGAAPSDLAAVLEKCREVNRHFFALRSRLLAAGERAQAVSKAATKAATDS